MDWSLYQRDGLDKRAILDFGEYIFDTTDISESLTHTQIVNPGGDFMIGVVSSAQLTFELNNLYQLIPDDAIIAKEFVYKAGAQISSESKKALFKKIRKAMVCLAGNTAFAGNTKAPYLTIWNLDGVQLDTPEQPLQPVKSLFVVDGKLYCGHNESPYLTAYSITGNTLKKLADVALNAFQTNKIQCYNKRAAAFSMEGNTFREYIKAEITELIDGNIQTTLINFVENTFEFSQIGVFIAEKPERKNDISIAVTAYDRMDKFDAVIDVWNSGIVYPITAGKMLQSLCDYLKVGLETQVFLNSDYVIQKSYEGENISGKQVLQWIAQLAASFATINESGKLELGWYKDAGYEINESSYTDIKIAEYATPVIEKLQVRTNEPDIGVVVPPDQETGAAYIIENNALLYAESDAELRPIAEKIFSAIKAFSYVPFSAKTIWGDPRRRAGHAATIKTLKGQTIKAYFMNCKTGGIRAPKGEYTATGNMTREVKSDTVNQKILRLRGKTNELIQTVDETRRTMTKYQEETEGTIYELKSELSQTAEDFRLSFIEQGDEIASLKFSSEGLDLAIKSGALKFDENGLTTYGGGFKILNADGSEEILSIDHNGKLEISGYLSIHSSGFYESQNGIKFYNRGDYCGSIYGTKDWSIPYPLLEVYGMFSDLVSHSFHYVDGFGGRHYTLSRKYISQLGEYVAVWRDLIPAYPKPPEDTI